ncbi:MAG: hypothetical protein ACJ04Q_08600 [Flavobacteriales bacterium]|nr:hypothetical protein [Flavobacteriales bacterium]
MKLEISYWLGDLKSQLAVLVLKKEDVSTAFFYSSYFGMKNIAQHDSHL